MPPGNFLNFESLKRHFLHFEGTFELITFLTVYLTIFNKYFGPNGIRFSFAFHFESLEQIREQFSTRATRHPYAWQPSQACATRKMAGIICNNIQSLRYINLLFTCLCLGGGGQKEVWHPQISVWGAWPLWPLPESAPETSLGCFLTISNMTHNYVAKNIKLQK